ncbi:MAG: cytidylate kinase family protein [Candidatus Bathyarchaeota archaeon]|nr:cytidylate kinase family protein [Candidatus Bathyarchaeota archaeon]MDI6805665.1 cytidylate kinase family protein [Candidatus Bathyarchaeia archaeon]
MSERKKSIVICICGMAGSGKSTLAKKLAEKYGLKYYSGGDALKALALDEGYKTSESGWWESEEGKRFLEKRGKDPKFDKVVDEKLLELAKQGNVVLDSWTMPWLLKEGFKVWLEASPNKRAGRIAFRDGINVKEAFNALKNKEERTKAIYKRLYGFSLGEDFSPFHLILDTDFLEADEVFQVLCMVVDNLILHSKNY